MSFKVARAGFLTTVQDLGRFGYSEYGMARSGAMDQHASRWANHLLANSPTHAVVEVTIGQLELEAQLDTLIAICGAEMDFQINGQPKANWQSHVIRAGDHLQWNNATSGLRSYLAVKNGFQTEINFGSRSTTVREGIGAVLNDGDRLSYIHYKHEQMTTAVPHFFQPDYKKPLILRLLPAYQYDLFNLQQRRHFFEQRYTLTNESDRTGARLSGNPIESVPATMVSEGMSYGSVEITSAGLPIVLMNDSPTMGGYPKIGTVFSLDLFKLAQRQALTDVCFQIFNIEQAQSQLSQFLNFFNQR